MSSSTLTLAQLSGLACVQCGRSDRPMVPTGIETPHSSTTFRCLAHAFRCSPHEKFNPETATAAEMAQEGPGIFQRREWNSLKKQVRASDLKFALTTVNHIQYFARMERDGFADERNRLTGDQESNWRAWYTLEWHWLTDNPCDDMTDRTRHNLLKDAIANLPACQRARDAVHIVADADDWSEYSRDEKGNQIPKSPTHEKVCERYASTVDPVRQALVDLLTVEQVAALRLVEQRRFSMRSHKRRFVISAPAADDQFRFKDVTLSSPGVIWLHADFWKSIGAAVTLSQVKTLCSAWQMPVRVFQVGGEKVVFSEEKTQNGVPCFCVRSVKTDDAAVRAFIDQHLVDKNA